jgi:hypothetical protein
MLGTPSSYFVALSNVGSSAVSEATAASIPETVTQWSDNFGQTCSITNFGQAQFVSPANQAAWNAVGLSNTPTQQSANTPRGRTASGCVDGSAANASNGGGLAHGGGVTDVSSLSRDPTTLAHELTSGTTGMVGIDQLAILPGQNPGFARVVPLLVGPLTGTSPALNAAIFKALALMPGVRALGETTTHTGTTGLGFDAPGSSPASNIAIVVDQGTGALLEARNIGVYGLGLSDVVSAFATPAFSRAQGWGGQTVIHWIDPAGPAQVVDAAALPASLHPAPIPTALITAVARPGTSEAQISALDDQLIGKFGALTFMGMENGQKQAGGRTTMTFILGGASSKVPAIAQVLRSSPIVSSVVVDTGDT